MFLLLYFISVLMNFSIVGKSKCILIIGPHSAADPKLSCGGISHHLELYSNFTYVVIY